MTEFSAGFNGTRIFVDGEKEFQTGEILTKYLSKNFKGLDDIHFRCKRYAGILRYPETSSEAVEFNRFIQGAISFYNKVEDIILSLPPYNVIKPKRNRLEDILEEYGWLFEDEYDEEDALLGYHNNYTVDMALEDYDKADTIDAILEFNLKLKKLAAKYLVFIEDLIRVKTVYEPLLERIHSQSRYLDNTETAQVIYDFTTDIKVRMKEYEKLKHTGNMQLSYTVIYKKKSPVLCELYRFETIGAFLYIELFKGLEQHYLPKKCGYCNRYFLLEAGIFSDYCTRPVKGMEDKICRDVGHRKKYADKVKNDPVWQTYVRAYKQHYARYLTKKITQAEFQKWADYALELRQRALEGELVFEEFRREIRK